MGGWYGITELLLVFGLVLGWGLWELRSMRRYKREQAERDGAGKM